MDAKDYPGVLRAVYNLQLDIQRVTDCSAGIVHEVANHGFRMILIGTIGHSAVIDQLISHGKLDVRTITGK